jgi:heme A synthase
VSDLTSHFWLMVLFAFFVSLVFAVLLRDSPREQLKTGAMMLGAFVAAAYVLGWVMYLFPL